jgi:hypothetical protein
MLGKIRYDSQHHDHNEQDKQRIHDAAVKTCFELKMLDPELESQDKDDVKNDGGDAFDDEIVDPRFGFLSQRFKDLSHDEFGQKGNQHRNSNDKEKLQINIPDDRLKHIRHRVHLNASLNHLIFPCDIYKNLRIFSNKLDQPLLSPP